MGTSCHCELSWRLQEIHYYVNSKFCLRIHSESWHDSKGICLQRKTKFLIFQPWRGISFVLVLSKRKFPTLGERSRTAVDLFRMNRRKTSSEVQARIQQRYEDTALLIFRQQPVNKPSNSFSSPQTRHTVENVREVQELRGQPAPTHDNVQSQICVII